MKRDKPLTTIRMRVERERAGMTREEKSDEKRAWQVRWQGERGRRGQVDVYLHVSRKRGIPRGRVQ